MPAPIFTSSEVPSLYEVYSRVQWKFVNSTYVASIRGGRNFRCDCGSSHNNSFGKGKGRGVFIKYNHCDITNHTVEACWEPHGKGQSYYS